MIPVPQNLADYVALLESGQPFTHTNIGGDGEFLTITGWTGTNSDGRESTPEKAEALAKVILEPRCDLHGYNPGKAGSEKLLNAERWLREHGVNVPHKEPSYIDDPDFGKAKVNVRWVHKEIISSANARGEWAPFLAALRKCPRLVVVGGDWLPGDLMNRMGAAVLALPDAIGWDSLALIEKQVRGVLSVNPDPPATVCWCLGYLSKVLTWRLAPDYPNVTQLDLGACFDPYCGVYNRHGYKADTWPENMRRNLEGLAA